jgi:uncharacterized membrane protein YkvA (DUF1232 family)
MLVILTCFVCLFGLNLCHSGPCGDRSDLSQRLKTSNSRGNSHDLWSVATRMCRPRVADIMQWRGRFEYLLGARIASGIIGLVFLVAQGALWEGMIAGFALFYAVLPFDLIPDYIPYIGLLDDIFVLAAVISVFAAAVAFGMGYLRAQDAPLPRMHPAPAVPGVLHAGLPQPAFVHDDDEDCIICAGEKGPRDHYLYRCGHRFCMQDAYELGRRRLVCPFDRQPIESIHHV